MNMTRIAKRDPAEWAVQERNAWQANSWRSRVASEASVWVNRTDARNANSFTARQVLP